MAADKLTAPDAAQWKTIGVYSAGQAACLLLDIPPGDADEWALPPRAAALEARIRAHFGLARPSPNRPSAGPATIDHAQLTAFAVAAGIPRAMILDDKPERLDPRRETTRLCVIRALARLAGMPAEPHKAAGIVANQLTDMGLTRDPKAIAKALKDAENCR